ncbi:hypothetical protein C359_04057 [Cryptococcus neoformans Bt120]|nr:hypothetical protein C360_05179 [Cryptococcus neoformans var. grubii Bt15]OXG39155.1 hypothetical protein C359_04057 [Cryptococcus neoformans var. grubii Bt120]
MNLPQNIRLSAKELIGYYTNFTDTHGTLHNDSKGYGTASTLPPSLVKRDKAYEYFKGSCEACDEDGCSALASKNQFAFKRGVQQTSRREYEYKLWEHGSSVETIVDSLDAGTRRKLGDDVTVLLGDEMGKIKLESRRKRRRIEGSNPLELVKRFTMSDEESVGDSTFGGK